MSNIRRPGSTIDTRRLGQAVSYPGIDPRVWCSLAFVTDFFMDPEHGPFVDIVLMPSAFRGTARLGTDYAGGGYGSWGPIRVDDEVVVVAPSGDPANGYVVVARLWSASDSPAAQMAANPDDPLLQAAPGRTLRLLSDTKVQLAAADADQSSVRGDAFLSDLDTLLDAISAAVGGIVAKVGTDPVGTPAKTAIDVAIQNFRLGTHSTSKVKIP